VFEKLRNRDAASIRITKDCLADESIKEDLAFIQANFCFLSQILESQEKSGSAMIGAVQE
jgi:hypothetical protein